MMNQQTQRVHFVSCEFLLFLKLFTIHSFIISEIDDFTLKPIHHDLVRLIFKLNEVWSPEYQDDRSDLFKEKCETIGKRIEDLYERERTSYNNRINARVIEIR